MCTVPYKRDMSKNPKWKGGEIVRTDGYIIVRIGTFTKQYKGKRYDLKHRIIMSNHLGRELMRSEIVHHLNGDKQDNRIENLKLISQAEHAKEHDKERIKNNKGQYT